MRRARTTLFPFLNQQLLKAIESDTTLPGDPTTTETRSNNSGGSVLRFEEPPHADPHAKDRTTNIVLISGSWL
jgi:hypothetical protein